MTGAEKTDVEVVERFRDSQDGPDGVDADDDARRALFFDLLGRTGDGTASSSGNHEHVDDATARLENFFGSLVVVRQRIGRVGVLRRTIRERTRKDDKST